MIFYLLIILTLSTIYGVYIGKVVVPEWIASFMAPIFMWLLTKVKQVINRWTAFLGTEATVEKGFMVIPFVFRGKSYLQRLPYHLRNSRTNYKFIGYRDDVKNDLQHHPGLEFFGTAGDLGYQQIVMLDSLDQEIKQFETDHPIKI
ncbi:Hypothetical protein POVR1_LOCUS469 [uncultured virus]|nr:Hypothetical protein POVR1_LOCUS469 [uncultured virus]